MSLKTNSRLKHQRFVSNVEGISNINITTLNIQTLKCDIKLANTIQAAKKLKIDILALQEVRREGQELLEFDDGELEGWRIVWSGFKRKGHAGVAFVLSPEVELIDHMSHLDGRIMSILVVVKGMKLRVTNVYAPTNEASDSIKDNFYAELRKTEKEITKTPKYKSVLLGDFNATIGMDSEDSGIWNYSLGSNNSNMVKTNNNGERFLTFASKYRYKITNSIFRSKRIHRGTWYHAPSKKWKRLDYILVRKFVMRFTKSCRVYRGATKYFQTDHSLLSVEIKFPCKKSRKSTEINSKRPPKPKLDISTLRSDPNVALTYSATLDKKLQHISPSQDKDVIVDEISSSIKTSLQTACPLVVEVKRSNPWEDQVLITMIKEQKSCSKQSLHSLQQKIKNRRKYLKNEFYKAKAEEINSAAEARQVEKEFRLAKKFSMHRQSSNISIPKPKLAKHFEQHFAARPLSLPPELENSMDYPHLNDHILDIDESAPKDDELESVISKMKNNKSSGTDKISSESLKYCSSKNLITALVLLFSIIWSSLSIPGTWLHSSITCLYKKGKRSLPENYRALSVGANLSKILSRVILNRIGDSYEQSMSETQFGFRRGRSTCDAIFILNNIINKYDGLLVATFVDLTAAYDHIPRDFLFRVLSFRTGAKLLVNLLCKMYQGTTAAITGCKYKFDVLVGCRQGGLESSSIFNLYFDFVLKICANEIDRVFPNGWGVPVDFIIPGECTNRTQRRAGRMNGIEFIKWILYADDLVLFSLSVEEANKILNIINTTCNRFGLTISFKKTKTMVFGNDQLCNNKSIISIGGVAIDNVNNFCYLGHTINNGNNSEYINHRTSAAISKFNEMSNVLQDQHIKMNTRMKLLEACVRSRLLYATQCSYPKEADIKKLEVCWHRFLRRMVRGGFRRRNADENDFAFVYSNKDLESIVKTPPLRDIISKQYLKYVAHVCRQPNVNLTKIIMFAMPKKKYFRDPWIQITQLLGNISVSQARRETQSREGFINLLTKLY